MTPLQGVPKVESILVRIHVNWNQMLFIFQKCNLERIQNKSNIGFFDTVESNQFFAEFHAENFLTHIEWSSVADLQGSGSDDSGLLKAGVGSCWFNHENH